MAKVQLWGEQSRQAEDGGTGRLDSVQEGNWDKNGLTGRAQDPDQSQTMMKHSTLRSIQSYKNKTSNRWEDAQM